MTARIAIWIAESGLALLIARFRRWLHLLCIGRWRGECAISTYICDESGERMDLVALCSGRMDDDGDVTARRVWGEAP